MSPACARCVSARQSSPLRRCGQSLTGLPSRSPERQISQDIRPAFVLPHFGAAPAFARAPAPSEGWCQRRDLNPRPKAYESSALPLSYSGSRNHNIFPKQPLRCQIGTAESGAGCLAEARCRNCCHHHDPQSATPDRFQGCQLNFGKYRPPPVGPRYGVGTSWIHWVSVRYSSPLEVRTVA
jgi:hypothetical protein